MQPLQQVPTESGTSGEFARQLATIIGPAYSPGPGTRCGADFLALGGALAGARTTNLSSLNEAFASTVTQLLSEYETQYGLARRPDLSASSRRTRILAKIRASRAGSPQGILRAVRVIDPTATITEVTPDDISPRTDDGTYPGSTRDVYFFYVLVDVSVYVDTDKMAQINAIVQQMKPAHCDFLVTFSIGFILDTSSLDINSL